MGFGARLLLALLLTSSLIGALGYELMARELRHGQLDAYSSAQRADVRSIEAVGRESDPTTARVAIDQLIAAIARRDGVLESLLINPSSVILASGTSGVDIGRRLETLKVVEPPKRQAGEKVASVDELVGKLKALGVAK